jgi:murein DD-endopeptidase MepM/ murein hydrolase activator NlpD
MARRLALGLLLSVLVLISASVGGQARADSRLGSLQEKIAAATARESALNSQIGTIETKIRALESQVGGVSARLVTLQHDLALQQEKLNRIQKLYGIQTEQLDFLNHQYSVSVDRLNLRMIQMYESHELTTLDVLLSTDSLGDVLDKIDFVEDIGAQDSRISTEVRGAKTRVHDARARTKVTRDRVAAVTRTVAVRTAQVRSEKERLLISERGLSKTKRVRRAQLAAVQQSKAEYLHEAAGLQASSSQVSAQIQSAGSSSYDSTPSASGLIWPVNGPVVSPFGWRWGRMHEGIDIAVGYGTPIHAAASGTVIFAGWMGGYGNFVIVDHGGGISTGYAHQSSIATGGGTVSQGQVIGYVGCTGHCFGPHLHFEVRINGSPVDPLGYL